MTMTGWQRSALMALPAAIVLTIILALFNVAGIVGFVLAFLVCFIVIQAYRSRTGRAT
jgi:hypothetical protein